MIDVASRAPDAIEPLLGCRLWRLDRATGTLRSIAQPVSWQPGRPMQAICLRRGHLASPHGVAPDPTCECGVWAFPDPSLLVRILYRPILIPGLVKLWGRVVVGTRGWRAERAYPAALLVVPSAGPSLFSERPLGGEEIARVAERYGVPVLDRWPELPAARTAA